MTSPTRSRVPFLLIALLGFAVRLPAADAAVKYFDVPAAAAEKALRLFSAQSGLQVGFPTDITRGVVSRPVRGEFPPEKALALLLADTGLTAVQDPKTGAFAVRRTRPGEPKNGHRAAPRTVSDRPVNSVFPNPLIKTQSP